MAQFDWESVAPGLRVSVSIGLAEALPEDTAEAVVLRADQSMYRAKPAPPVTARSRIARSARATMSVAPRNRDI